jgi:fatty acid synthase, animal type
VSLLARKPRNSIDLIPRCSLWKSYGVNVTVDTADVTSEQGCRQLLEAATRMAPVGGIFNLAVALRDKLLENQTVEMFRESLAPKAEATKHLDQLSRVLCPELEQFVVFSSVSCGRGNVGQTNYGLANSIMERIIEGRNALQLPAKAVQWGAVGDVGLLAELQEKNMDMTISGSLPQRISSCIEVLDLLLTTDEPIVSSMVVADKKVFDTKNDNVIEVLFNILGIQDKKSISMETPLSKLGLDSLMTVEISQLLEREYGLFLTMKELHTISLFDLEQRAKGNHTTTNTTKTC